VQRRLSEGILVGYHVGGQWRVTGEGLRRYVAKLKGPAAAPRALAVLPTPWGSGCARVPGGMPSVTHPGATTTAPIPASWQHTVSTGSGTVAAPDPLPAGQREGLAPYSQTCAHAGGGRTDLAT
jgi:hypothetical protein